MTTAIIGTGGIGSAITASACCRWRDPPALELLHTWSSIQLTKPVGSNDLHTRNKRVACYI